MTKQLNDKGISLDKLNKLNNEHKQKVQEMTKELNNKNISLNKYKENINKLDNEFKKEIQELKKELKESKEYIDSDKKDTDKVMKDFNKLYNNKQNYIKEKQIIKQELKEQELNKKKQELANNKKIIDDLNIKIKSLEGDDKLMEEIKVSKDSRTSTKIPQSVRKKNYKARTFVLEDFKNDSLPLYNEKSNRLENLENEYQKKYITKKDLAKTENLHFEQIKKNRS